MKQLFPSLLAFVWLLSAAVSGAGEFKHVGDYLLKSKMKLTGDKATPIMIKPMLLSVYTDGVEIRVTVDRDEEATSTFEIYRSDGIGRQRVAGGAIEIIPGLQGFNRSTGTFSHLRLSRESLTITSFPGVSDQTIVSYAIGVIPAPEAATQPAKAEAKPTGPDHKDSDPARKPTAQPSPTALTR